jgi:tetratricopeptide (TPR) repeat protein
MSKKVVSFLAIAFLAIVMSAAILYSKDQNIDSAIEQIDILSKQKMHEQSLALCEEIYEIDKENYEIIWRLSREYAGVGYYADFNKDKKEIYLDKALVLSKQAMEMRPDRPEGYLRYAVVLGCYAGIRGGKEKVYLAGKVRDVLEETIKVDPNYYKAYYGLGLWHREIAGLSKFLRMFAKILYGSIPEGSFEEAVKNMNKCLELKSDYVEVWYELGKTYMKMKKWENARDSFGKCLSLKPDNLDEEEYQLKAKKRLKKVHKKLA